MNPKVLDLRGYREEKEKKNQGDPSSLKDILSQAVGPDKMEELKFEEPVWVKDLIRYLEPEKAPRIARHNPGDKYDVFFPTDPRYHELHIRAGSAEKDLIQCLYGVRMGNSGCSWIEPFPTFIDTIA
jgi:hypothetical protein